MVLVWGRKVFGCLRDTEPGMPLRDCQYRSGAGGEGMSQLPACCRWERGGTAYTQNH